MQLLTTEQLRTVGVGPIDLSLSAGEIVCLSGPSGAGKSLLLRAIADLDPHEGRVQLDDTQADSIPAHQWRQRVGYLAAESAWWFDTIAEHFTCDAQRLGRFGSSLGFPEGAERWEIARLSTGERQRWAIARLLAGVPEVLLLDEPTASLDPESCLRVEQLIDAYRREHQAAVLWVSHDAEQIKRIADRPLRIVDGKLEPST